MKIQALNGNISFKNNENKGKHDDYFKWVSQNKVNRELVMAKGREVENGKFEAVGTALTVPSILGLVFGLPMLFFKSKTKLGVGLLLTSAFASWSKEFVDRYNLKCAEETAGERGVDMSILKNKGPVKEVYRKTDEVYKQNIISQNIISQNKEK